MFRPASPRIAALACLLLVGSSGVSLAQDKVGVSSAVNTIATGVPPQQQPRRLVIGQDVVFNERITTNAGGQTQLLFLDESSMTIGPNSDLTIDQFVYDPKSGTGRLAMSATRGLLRYVGGKLSKQDGAVTMRTSSATLAVRGGAFILDTAPQGPTDAIFLYGKGLTATGLCGVPAVQCGTPQTVFRPGFEIIISGPGASPSSPSAVPPGKLAQDTDALDGRQGGNGGAPVIPTDATVAASGIAQTISGNLPQSLQQSGQNSAPPGAPPQFQDYYSPIYPNTLPIQSTSNSSSTTGASATTQATSASSVSQVLGCISQNACDPTGTTQVGVVAGTSPPAPVGGPNSVVSVGTMTNGFTNTTATTGGVPNAPAIAFAGRLKNTNDPTVGFVDNTPANDIPYSGGMLSNGTFTGNFGSFGTISFPLAPGFNSIQGSSSALGAFTGSSFLSADNSFFYVNFTPTSQPGERLFMFGGTPAAASLYQPTGATRIFAFTVQPDGALQSNIPFIRGQAGGNLANATVSPFYVVAPATTAIGDATTLAAARGLQASLAVSGTAAGQQSAIAVTAGEIGALQSSGQPIFTGQLRGSSMLSASGTPTRLAAAVSSTVDGNGNSFYGSGGGISGFVLDQTAYQSGATAGTVGAASTPSTASETPLSGSATSYGFAQPALPTATPAGVGASRTSQVLSGNFGGLMYTNAQPNPYIVVGGTVISTDAVNNRLQAELVGTARSSSGGVNALNLQFGSLTGTAGAQAFVDDHTFAATESPVNPQQITIGESTLQSNGQLYLVSSGAAGVPTALFQQSGATPCQCQYLQWGYWGGDLTTPTVGAAAGERIDRGHINTWVAGVETPLADIQNLMATRFQGTYNGAAIGSVFNNGQSYLATGGFSGTYNFGTQSGSMTISNFDIFPRIVAQCAAANCAPLFGPNNADYTFSGGVPQGTLSVNGAFYGPKAAETGGSFAIRGSQLLPTYLASGVFAGKR